MRHALLAGDAPDEHDGRPCPVDAEALDDVRLDDGTVEVGVDAVVDDVDVGGVERRVAGQDVAARGVADGDHGVGSLVGGALGPRREPVAAAELLLLPRPLRLERV